MQSVIIYINIAFDSYATENRGEFLDKLQRARSQIKIGTPSQPILSKAGPARLVVGNWTLTCKKDGELQIQNTDGQQVLVDRNGCYELGQNFVL